MEFQNNIQQHKTTYNKKKHKLSNKKNIMLKSCQTLQQHIRKWKNTFMYEEQDWGYSIKSES